MTSLFPYFVNNSSYLLDFADNKLPLSSYIFTKFARIAIFPFESKNLILYPFMPVCLVSITNFAVVTFSRFKCMCHDLSSLPIVIRSEEHTSELQSRENLVCRLLLEKKN